MYITDALTRKHGKSRNCAACAGRASHHTAACRQRITGLAEAEDAKKTAEAAARAEQSRAATVEASEKDAEPKEERASSSTDGQQMEAAAPMGEDYGPAAVGGGIDMDDDGVSEAKRILESGASLDGKKKPKIFHFEQEVPEGDTIGSLTEVGGEEMLAAILAVLEEPWQAHEEEPEALHAPGEIEPAKLAEMRATHMARIQKCGVYEEFPEEEYDRDLDGAVIDGRWVDDYHKYRLVAKEFHRKTELPKLTYAGTPDGHGLRCMLSFLAEDERRKMARTDAESAYYQSPAMKNEHGRTAVVRFPDDGRTPGTLARLQAAGRSWSDHQASVYASGGHERCPRDSQMWRKRSEEGKLRM